MKKRDFILAAVLLIAAAAGFLFLRLSGKTEGTMVQITIDGQVYGTYPLDQNQEIEVKQDDAYNRVIIEDGVAYMEDADCPDRYCVEQGRIHTQKQTIVCLPHKLVVEIVGDASEKEMMPDTIAK